MRNDSWLPSHQLEAKCIVETERGILATLRNVSLAVIELLNNGHRSELPVTDCFPAGIKKSGMVRRRVTVHIPHVDNMTLLIHNRLRVDDNWRKLSGYQ